MQHPTVPFLTVLAPLTFALASCGSDGEARAATGPEEGSLEAAVEETITEIRVDEKGVLGVTEEVFRAQVDERLAVVDRTLAELGAREGADAEHLRDQVAASRRQVEAELVRLEKADEQEKRESRLDIAATLALIERRLEAAGHAASGDG